MALQYPNVIHAAGAMGASAPLWQADGTVEKTAPGVYELTLDEAADETACSVIVTLGGATGGQFAVEQTTDKKKTVRTFAADGVTPADRAFNWLVIRAPGA